MRKRVCLSTILLLVAACTTSPTGRRQLTLLPDSQMNTLGLEAFSQMKQDLPIEEDPAINAYVRCVALSITDVVRDETGVADWEVVVFKDDSANAFALPGGKIGVHTGLLDVAKNEHQLAAVIGHEVAHVIARHSNERVSAGFAAQSGLALASILLGEQGDQERGYMLGLLGLGAQVGVLLPYSRVHESEADIMGQEIMARAGFDPRESVQLWRNMAAAGNGAPPEWLSTHPSHGRRIADLEANMPRAISIYDHARATGHNPRCR